MHPLINIVQKSVSLTEEEVAATLYFFQEKKYKRNEILLRAGEVSHHVYFVQSGGLHQFYLDEAGNERTCNFTFENEFVTDLESFSQQTRSASSIKALEPTVCYQVNCVDLVELLKQSPAVSEFFRIVVERVASESIRRTKNLLSFSPEKQFNELLEQRPDIFQRVPQKLIAQYLGIAPESLSRIKKRILVAAKS